MYPNIFRISKNQSLNNFIIKRSKDEHFRQTTLYIGIYIVNRNISHKTYFEFRQNMSIILSEPCVL